MRSLALRQTTRWHPRCLKLRVRLVGYQMPDTMRTLKRGVRLRQLLALYRLTKTRYLARLRRFKTQEADNG